MLRRLNLVLACFCVNLLLIVWSRSLSYMLAMFRHCEERNARWSGSMALALLTEMQLLEPGRKQQSSWTGDLNVKARLRRRATHIGFVEKSTSQPENGRLQGGGGTLPGSNAAWLAGERVDADGGYVFVRLSRWSSLHFSRRGPLARSGLSNCAHRSPSAGPNTA